MEHRRAKSKGMSPVSANKPGEIVRILRANRQIESKYLAQLLNILSARIFTKHLLHGIAGHDVHEQKHHRENEPHRGKSDQEPRTRFA